MKATTTTFLIAALASILCSLLSTSCKTTEEPSPQIEKFREDSDIGSIKPRQRRQRPH
jgi:hypothetical protein